MTLPIFEMVLEFIALLRTCCERDMMMSVTEHRLYMNTLWI